MPLPPAPDNAQPPRCKCGHWLMAHANPHLIGGWGFYDTNCVRPACGCLRWRPAETAR